MAQLPSREAVHAALTERHGAALQARLDSASVAICGLGGLGSNIAIALARAGVGRLILLDFDRVDLSNLHRQQYKISQIGLFKAEALQENLVEINPYLKIEAHVVRLDEGNMASLLNDADIICEAFDQAEAKAMLVNFVLEQLPQAYLIAASGLAGIDSGNTIQTRRLSSHFYLCGDGHSDVSDGLGLVASRAMLCASHEAHMVIRILANQLQP